MLLKFIFYVPQSHLDDVKTAVFNAGAGECGAYSNCCWQTLGVGQFKPSQESKPFIGKPDELIQVEEFQVATVCQEQRIIAVIQALKSAHPYESPVFDVWPLSEYPLDF